MVTEAVPYPTALRSATVSRRDPVVRTRPDRHTSVRVSACPRERDLGVREKGKQTDRPRRRIAG